MKSILFCLNLLLVLSLYAQDTSYFDTTNTEVGIDKAYYYKVIIKDSASNRAFEKQYYINHVQKEQLAYSNYDSLEISGNRIRWDEQGNMVSSHLFKNGMRHGSSIEYYPNGNIKSKKEYLYGGFQGLKVYDKLSGEQITILEEMPILPECENIVSSEERNNCTSYKMQEYIIQNIKLPDEVKDTISKGVSVTIYTRFVINENGDVEDLFIENNDDRLVPFENEIISTFEKFPKMIPGKQKGIPVMTQYTIPVRWIIQF